MANEEEEAAAAVVAGAVTAKDAVVLKGRVATS